MDGCNLSIIVSIVIIIVIINKNGRIVYDDHKHKDEDNDGGAYDAVAQWSSVY